MKKYWAKKIGKMPFAKVNRILGTELDEGDVWLSEAAHRHIAEDHPEDYAVCFPYMEAALLNPTFIGQSPKQPDAFEIIYRPPGMPTHMLIAISLTKNPYGSYNVKSMYSIKEKAITSRRSAKRLFRVL